MTVGRIPSVEGGIQPTLLDAKADLITATANDTPARLGVGANDTVLTADSSTATGLKWAAPASGGGFTLIATASPSAASSFSFTSIPSTYKHLFVLVPELVWSTTAQQMKMRFATGSYYSTRAMGTLNNTGTFSFSTGRGDDYFGESNALQCPIQQGYTSSGVFGDISSATALWIYDYTNTSQDKVVNWQAGGQGGMATGVGIYDNNAAVSNIEFVTTSGTVTGAAYLYGVS